MTNEEVVPDSAPLLGSALKSLCTSKIIKAQCAKQYGTQLKIMLTLEGNQKAIFKPQWYEINSSSECKLNLILCFNLLKVLEKSVH